MSNGDFYGRIVTYYPETGKFLDPKLEARLAGAGGLSVIDNGDGTYTLTDTGQVIDNGDGTLTLTT